MDRQLTATHEIRTRYALDMHQICTRYALDTHQIRTRYALDMQFLKIIVREVIHCTHHTHTHHTPTLKHIHAHTICCQTMGSLRLVGAFKLQVSFAKEPYKRRYILQKRPIIFRSLRIVATPQETCSKTSSLLVQSSSQSSVVHVSINTTRLGVTTGQTSTRLAQH